MGLPYKLGSQGAEIIAWQQWAIKNFKAYANLLGPGDGYYGNSDATFVREMQRRLGIVQDGIFGERTAAMAGYKVGGQVPTVPARRPIWFYSAPGSGAPWWLGPSYDVGQMVAGTAWNEPHRQSLRINHQPVGYPIGGYLGLMGGDSKLSYLEVIQAQKIELARLLRDNPDVKRALGGGTRDVELWFSGYSQSADGLVRAIAELFGDGGEFAALRDRINGLLCFGNPATPTTGIARITLPEWLNRLTVNINTRDDFYAVAKDHIRPAFYAEIIKAEAELPFFVHVLRIAVPIILEWAATLIPFIKPILGGGSLFGPMAQLALGSLNGLQGLGNNPVLGGLLGLAGGGKDLETTKTIQDILGPDLLDDIPALITLVGALPGLQSHGAYHATAPARPEFADGMGRWRTGTQLAYDHIANYRR